MVLLCHCLQRHPLNTQLAVGGGGRMVLIWPIDWTVVEFGESRQKDETQGVTVRRSSMGETNQQSGSY